MHGRTSDLNQRGSDIHWHVTTEEFEALIDKARNERARYFREWFKSLFSVKPRRSEPRHADGMVGHNA